MSVRKIGSYVVEEALGAGSFATVWQAFDPVLDARVAIKVLAENWAQHDDVRRRFIEEARILRRIDDDAIVRIHVIDELEDGRPYFVMALADNGSLTERLHDGPMELAAARSVAVSILECLSVVHDFGVVHRDIKPSNVFFRTVRPHQRAAAERAGRTLGTERVVLGDFGLAKDTVAASGFTLAAGTPAYMAPEQAKSSAVLDPRADLYSVGVILYEMLAGAPPFEAATLSDVRSGRDLRGATPLREAAPHVPPAVVAVVERAMATDPAQRFETASQMRQALIAAWDGSDQESVPLLELSASGLEGRIGSHFRRLHELDVGAERAAAVHRIRAMVFEPTLMVHSSVGPPVGLDGVEVSFVDDPVVADVVVGGDQPGMIWLASPDSDPQVAELIRRRLPEFAAARALAEIDGLMRGTPRLPAATRRAIREVVDGVLDEVPGIAAIQTARASVSASLPAELGSIARQILVWDHAGRQLGLSATADAAEIEAALLPMLERWRTLSNGGRLAFSARPIAEGVIVQLERLWLDVVGARS